MYLGLVSMDNGGKTGSGGGWSEFIQRIAEGWSQTGQKVVLAQNVPRGTYRQTTPHGETIYIQPEGTQQNIFTRTEVGGTIGARGEVAGFGTLFVVGGIVFGAILLLSLTARR